MAQGPLIGSRIDPTYTWKDELFLLMLLMVGILYTITAYAWLEVSILLFERRLKYVSALIASVAAVGIVVFFGFTVNGLSNTGLNTNIIASF